MGEQRLLAVCRFLGALGRLEHVLVQLRKCLTFMMPSPINLFIPNSADLKRNRAGLPSMWRGRRGMPTSAWRLRTGVALYAPETVLRQWFSTLWGAFPSPFRKNEVEVGAHQAGQPVVMAGRTTAV